MVNRCDHRHSCLDGNKELRAMDLPTRVLDISRGNTNIYLREATGLPERYVCLSHCWGSKLPLRTTTDNIDEHRKNIVWDSLPVVYRETIEISRMLGVKYVRIDSLCIVQDSESDWAHEFTPMIPKTSYGGMLARLEGLRMSMSCVSRGQLSGGRE